MLNKVIFNGLLILSLLLAPLPAGRPASAVQVNSFTPGLTERVSVASDGTQSNNVSVFPSISADGRFVAFVSSADNLVSGDTNMSEDIFVHDRQTGTTERVSVASDGMQSDSISSSPSISADGRFVAFASGADNLVSGDSNYAPDIFVHDRQTGKTELVSVASDGKYANNASYTPSISADGHFVAFSSIANNLVSDDTNAEGDVFVHDRQTGTTERVSVASDGMQGDGISSSPSISADGRFTAFSSMASNLVSGDFNYATDIFVHDHQTGTTERVSVASDGVQGNDSSSSQSISADGHFVAFTSMADNLVSGDSNASTDIFVYDRYTGKTELVSVASDGTHANNLSRYSSISADGRFVGFVSYATNLVSGDTNGDIDVFVHDRQTGKTELSSKSSNGMQGNISGVWGFSISADGRFIAFDSASSNLVSGDTNDTNDVFVHQRFDCAETTENILVMDESCKPIPGAQVFRNGSLAGTTGTDGALSIPGLAAGDSLIARKMILEKSTPRANHSQHSTQNWVYRVYITSLDIPKDTAPSPFSVINPDITQEVVIKKNNTLIGFNILASLEWDANASYLNDLQQGFLNASAYLYDATNGQMVFEELTIVDNNQYMVDADYQFIASNQKQPESNVHGLFYNLTSYLDNDYHMYMGRYWERTGANKGNWSETDGFRGIIHEFGHYGLGLYDSYKDAEGNNNYKGHCTSSAIRDLSNHHADVNATLMDWPYNATEFADSRVPSLWSSECENTMQWNKNQESDWETILANPLYKDIESPARWVLKSPADYQGVVAGPNAVPTSAWNTVTIGNDANTGACDPPFTYETLWNLMDIPGVDVVLRKSDRDIVQGKTDANGEVTILGAASGDRVILSVNLLGAEHTTSIQVSCPAGLRLQASQSDPVTKIQVLPAPYQVTVETLPDSTKNQGWVIVKASKALPSAPQAVLTQSSAASWVNVPLSYNDSLKAYSGALSLNPALPPSGVITIKAVDDQNQVVEIPTTFSLNQVDPGQDWMITSSDAQAQIYFPAGAISSAGQVSINLSTLLVTFPDKMRLLSGPYTISASSGTSLSANSNLSISYLDLAGSTPQTNLENAQIYEFISGSWQPLIGLSSVSQRSVSTSIHSFGTYAIFASSEIKIYLPSLNH